MPIVASATSGADFTPAPSGVQQAVCSAVFDMGEEYSEKFQNLSHKVVIFWEMAEKMQDGRPYMLSKKYTLSLSPKANLRKDLQSWRGREFTDEELKGFDLEKLVGVNIMLNVAHVTKDGKTRAQVLGLMPLMKGLGKISVTSLEVPKWAHEQKIKNADMVAKYKAQSAATHEEEEHAPEPIKPAASVPDSDVPFRPCGFWGEA